jgi:hypothetical protein
MKRARIGELLVEEGAIDREGLEVALRHQRQVPGPVGEILVRLRLVSEARLVDALGRQLHVPIARIGGKTVQPYVLGMLPEPLLRRYCAIPLTLEPLGRGRSRLALALSMPQDLAAVDALTFAAGVRVGAVLAGRRDIEQALDRHFAHRSAGEGNDASARVQPDPGDGSRTMELVCSRTGDGFRIVDE